MLSRRHFLYALLSQYAEEALQPRMVIVYICQCDLESNSKSKVGVRQASFWYSTFSSFHVVEEKRNLEMAFFKRSRARSRRLLNALDLLTFLKQNEVVYKSDLSQEHDFYREFQQVFQTFLIHFQNFKTVLSYFQVILGSHSNNFRPL